LVVKKKQCRGKKGGKIPIFGVLQKERGMVGASRNSGRKHGKKKRLSKSREGKKKKKKKSNPDVKKGLYKKKERKEER